MSNIKAYRRIVDKSLPGPVMEYFYFTKLDGRDWMADINDESAEGWGDEFKWNDEPFGCGVTSEEMKEIIKDATPIGYIDSETKELVITERWKVPVGYGYIGGKTVVTSWEWSDEA